MIFDNYIIIIMNNCYICLEKTSIYFKFKNCNCYLYCHEQCFANILKQNKCIICKKNINNTLLMDKINEEIENIFLLKLLNKMLYDNYIINYILKMKSKINFLLLVIYSIIFSIITIGLSIFILITYLIIYYYYFLKYRDTSKINYEKKYIIN